MKTKLFLKALLLSIPFLFYTDMIIAQGWEKTYGGANSDYGYSVQQTNDNGYIITGYTESFGAGEWDVYLIKTDINGDTLWTKTYGGINIDNGKSVKQTTDGGYVIAGYTNSFGTGDSDVYLIKTDENGYTMWTKTFGGSIGDLGYSVQQTNDNGYIIVGYTYSFGAGVCDVYLIKTNENGDTLWTNTYGGTDLDEGYSVQQTNDNGYIIAGRTNSFGAGLDDIYLIKTNTNGDTLWSKTYGGIGNEFGNSVQQTTDGGYVIAGYTNSFGTGETDVYLIKTNENGDTLWTKTFGGSYYDYGRSVQQTNDNGYVITGTISRFDSLFAIFDVYLIKTDSTGDTLWTKTYGSSMTNQGYSVKQTNNNGYIIAGFLSQGLLNADVYLIKTDSLGNTITNIISGNVFFDTDSNCNIDSGETNLSGWLVKIEPGPEYVTTNSNGYYSILVDTGTYTVTEILPNNLWEQTCPVLPDYHTVNFTTFYDTSYNNDFAIEPYILCPYLEVDISTWALRPCMNSTYAVSYCNNGTIEQDNVYIEVEFDDVVTPISSSIPWSSQNGYVYTFALGTLSPFQCETFNITAEVSCSAVLGSTHCIEARIYPDTLCFPPDITWDHSSVAVEGECVGDSSACFTIYNTGDPGSGDMQDSSEYRIYENNVLVFTGQFQLTGGDSLIVCRVTNGNAIRLEADQRPGHPGNSHPQETIEDCGDDTGTSLGQIIVIPEDDIDADVEIDCRVVTGSYDPNEKLVKPTGLTEYHYIDSTDVLEYQINFQNTGTDTAFRVVIRDTLSEFLDITTVETGTSSHQYSFRIYGQGILEWTYDNILLPDSIVNESASHGFVKFKVSQIPGNPKGTLIENRSGIIFDYNVPVITNTVWNIVYDTVLTGISEPVIYNNLIEVKVFPNPFNNITTFIISGLGMKEQLNFILYDLIVKEVKEINNISTNIFHLKRDNLTSGMYFYQLLNKKEIIATGKIIIN